MRSSCRVAAWSSTTISVAVDRHSAGCPLLSKLRSSQQGSALVEASLALPILALVLVGTMDFGRLFYRTMAITQAARAGAQFGTYIPGNANNIAGMQNAGLSAGSDITGLTVTATRDCACYTTTETALACNLLGSCVGQWRVYVNVTASGTFSTIINYPGIPQTVAATRTARLRAQ